MRATFPRSVGRERLVKTCLYTLPPDRDVVLDRLPGHDGVLLAVGAGHAFKFATQIGRILTELSLGGATPHDISLFRADRGALHDAGAPRTWHV